MPCPIHIWVPLIGAAAPVARIARNRLRDAMAARRGSAEPEAPRELKRWAPVGAAAGTTSEQRESSS
jgi:hypothetical protein